MTERGRMRTWALVAVGLGVVGVGFMGFKALGRRPTMATKTVPSAIAVREDSPLPDLAKAVARGDGMALAVLKNRVEKKSKTEVTPALTEIEAQEWTEAVRGLGNGFSKFSAYGRASAVVVASEVLQRFQISPGPKQWRDALRASADVLGSSLADQNWEVRVAAISEIKSLWNWSPGCPIALQGSWDMDEITKCKQFFHTVVKDALSSKDARTRTAAVDCLGALALNAEAEPAIRLLHDPDVGVRAQVLLSFADRPVLLTEDAILPLLHDSNAVIPPVAKRVLKTRGLSEEQIGLGSLVTHPRPDMRVSAIPFLKDRKDVDPIVWLVFLSRDSDEFVRSKAVDALALANSEEAKKRLAEMAASDSSPAIRSKAEKFAQPSNATADLPPLPPPTGALKLKAN